MRIDLNANPAQLSHLLDVVHESAEVSESHGEVSVLRPDQRRQRQVDERLDHIVRLLVGGCGSGLGGRT